MNEENQRDHDTGVRVPLHPRKAQELFFELLQVTSPETTAPRTPTPQSFQQRVARTKEYCANALKQLQRGQWMRTASKRRLADPMVLLRLAGDGAALELHAFSPRRDDDDDETIECLERLSLSSIQSLTISPDTRMIIRTHGDDARDSLFASSLEAPSEDVLVRTAVAVASSLSAHDDSKSHATLLWQAVRLRVIELCGGGVSLHEALATIEAAYEVITTRECESDLPPPLRLFRLRSARA